MSARKTPVLLRRAPLSGRINVLTNYVRGEAPGGQTMIEVRGDGKHDVTAAFYAILLEELLDGEGHEGVAGEAASSLIAILDGAADGEQLSKRDRNELRAFRERMVEIVDDHNARLEAGEVERA